MLAGGATQRELLQAFQSGAVQGGPKVPSMSELVGEHQSEEGDENELFDASDGASGSGSEPLGGGRVTGRPVGAATLVLVPTQELVHQVTQVIGDLAPAMAPLVRPAYSNKGVSRRDVCAIVVATPVALKDNVNHAQLQALKYLILDEADMLLSGTYLDMTQGYALAIFKQRVPERRPQTVFCAATLPSKGKRSVTAFLDRYYPEPGTLRVSTSGVHRPVSSLQRNTFVQLDAALPLTLEELESRSRLQDKVRQHAAEVQASLAAPRGAVGGAGPAPDDVADAEDAAVGSDAGSDADAAEEGSSGSDRLAEVMAVRSAENHAETLAADRAQYQKRVDSLRRHALLEALLIPVRNTTTSNAGDISTNSSGGSGAAGVEAVRAPAAEQAAVASAVSPLTVTGKRRRHTAASSLLCSVPGAAENRKKGAAPVLVAAAADASPKAKAAAAGPLPIGDADSTDAVLPLTLASGTELRGRVQEAEVPPAGLPPTLVFFNSADKADGARKFLQHSLPGRVRVAALHNRLDDEDRARIVAGFHSGHIHVLACTDVASRGLDTRRVAHVIQAEFAQDAVSYLHRIGRTARAGEGGCVTNLITRGSLALAQALVHAAAEGRPIDDAFSRRRSFRREQKRAAVTAAEERVVMAALEREQAAAAVAGATVPA
jgi:superfamily II DNA/RNA helicase